MSPAPRALASTLFAACASPAGLALASTLLAACRATPGAAVEPTPAQPSTADPPPPRDDAPPTGLRVVAESGAAIPGDIRLAVLWGNEDADPAIVITPLTTTATGGTLTITALPTPPPSMLMRSAGVGVAIGYFVAYKDLDGDGTLTIATDKPWRWPEFRGGVNRHVLVHATDPVRPGSPLHGFIGDHPGGLELLRVELTAQCYDDGCSGHDRMSFGPRPSQLTLVLPPDPAGYRFPNLD